MADPLKDFLENGILDALHPTLGQTWQVRVDLEDLRAVGSKGVGRIRELWFVVPGVLIKPTAIYRGLTDREDDWLCYVGTHAVAYDYRSGHKVNAWPGEVFLVYVNARGFVYNWRWETADALNPNLPCEHNVRYTEKLR